MFAGRSALIAVLFFSCSSAGALAAETTTAAAIKPLRHLEYSFNVGILSEMTTHTSGLQAKNLDGTPSGPAEPASGLNQSQTGANDDGTIAVDILSVDPDGGVVLGVSEHGRQGRLGEPARCVTYGNTYFVCEGGKQVNAEEMELVRYLGNRFSTLSPLDTNQHWQYRQTAADFQEQTDFTVVSVAQGVASIQLERVSKAGGAGGALSTTNGRIVYDRRKSVPVSIRAQTVTSSDQPGGATSRNQVQIKLDLVADSGHS